MTRVKYSDDWIYLDYIVWISVYPVIHPQLYFSFAQRPPSFSLFARQTARRIICRIRLFASPDSSARILISNSVATNPFTQGARKSNERTTKYHPLIQTKFRQADPSDQPPHICKTHYTNTRRYRSKTEAIPQFRNDKYGYRDHK